MHCHIGLNVYVCPCVIIFKGEMMLIEVDENLILLCMCNQLLVL